MRPALTLVLGIAIAAVIAASTFLRPGGAGATDQYDPGTRAPQAPRSTFSLAEARTFQDFPVYYVGETFDAHPLVAVLRRKDTGSHPDEPIRANYVSFIYGDCDAGGDLGCAPPLEVQTSPACLYTPEDIALVPDEIVQARGVNAFLYDEGHKVVLVAGAATITIYGGSREEVVTAVQRLRAVNITVPPIVTLPPPDTLIFETCRAIIPPIEPPPPPAPR